MLTQSLCNSSQDADVTTTPVLRIDQGWHHHGFSDQKGG